jgi:hypothetical protein
MPVALAALSRRLEWLEGRRPAGGEEIIVNAVLGSLSDSDIELLEEHAVLRETGYDEDTVAVFMEEKYSRFQKAVEVFKERHQAILDEQKPKPKTTKQLRPAGTRSAPKRSTAAPSMVKRASQSPRDIQSKRI